MQRKIHVALVSIGLLLGTAGCTSFLTGDKLSSDPNLPSAATAQQLFVAVQAGGVSVFGGAGRPVVVGGGEGRGGGHRRALGAGRGKKFFATGQTRAERRGRRCVGG